MYLEFILAGQPCRAAKRPILLTWNAVHWSTNDEKRMHEKAA
jgi:hypothetical protein